MVRFAFGMALCAGKRGPPRRLSRAPRVRARCPSWGGSSGQESSDNTRGQPTKGSFSPSELGVSAGSSRAVRARHARAKRDADPRRLGN